jgi:hypothetical protein
VYSSLIKGKEKMLENELEKKLEKAKLEMLESEVDLIDDLPNVSLDELLEIFHLASERSLSTSEYIENFLQHRREFSQELFFSNFRVIKAVLVEIEYRIKENKI